MNTIRLPEFSYVNPSLFDKKNTIASVLAVIALHGFVGWRLANIKAAEIAINNVAKPLEISVIAPPLAPAVNTSSQPDQPVQPKTAIAQKTPINTQPKSTTTILPVTEPTPAVTQSTPVSFTEPKPSKPTLNKASPKDASVESMAEPPPKPEIAIQPAAVPELPTPKALAPSSIKPSSLDAKALDSEKPMKPATKTAQPSQAASKPEIERVSSPATQPVVTPTHQPTQAMANPATTKTEKPNTDNHLAPPPSKKPADTEVNKIKPATHNTPQTNAPMTFSAGQASWRRQPNFSCSRDDTNGETLSATIRYVVNRQGNAESVTLITTTGNAKVDRQLLQQARQGRFHPFTQHGQPVVGIINLPIRCQ